MTDPTDELAAFTRQLFRDPDAIPTAEVTTVPANVAPREGNSPDPAPHDEDMEAFARALFNTDD